MYWFVPLINQTSSSKKHFNLRRVIQLWFVREISHRISTAYVKKLLKKLGDELEYRWRKLYRFVSLSIDNNIIMTCIARIWLLPQLGLSR